MKVLIHESLVRYLLGQLHSQEDGDQRFLDFLVFKVDITLLCSFIVQFCLNVIVCVPCSSVIPYMCSYV